MNCTHPADDWWDDGDFRFCGDCGDMIAYWAEDAGWTEPQAA